VPPPGDRIKVLEERLRQAEAEIARLKAAVKELSGGGKKAGRLVRLPAWAVDCCGCWYQVGWWYYVPAPARKPRKPAGEISMGRDAGERGPATPSAGKRAVSLEADDVLPPPLPARIDISRMKKGDATTLFWKGYEAFHDKEYASAWKSFEAATRLSNGDARFWYYRALAERALGDKKAAEASRQAGIKAEKKRDTKKDELAFALERVQGERRVWLRLGSRPATRE